MMTQLEKNVPKFGQPKACTTHCILSFAKWRFSLKPFGLCFPGKCIYHANKYKNAVGIPHYLILGKYGDSFEIVFGNNFTFYIFGKDVRKYKKICYRLHPDFYQLLIFCHIHFIVPNLSLPWPSPSFLILSPIQICTHIHHTQILLYFYELLESRYSDRAPWPLNIWMFPKNKDIHLHIHCRIMKM